MCCLARFFIVLLETERRLNVKMKTRKWDKKFIISCLVFFVLFLGSKMMGNMVKYTKKLFGLSEIMMGKWDFLGTF